MRRIVYISTATQVDDDTLADILRSAQINNARDAISGFLIFNGRNFLQLIEGPEQALAALMDTLATDPRHCGIVCLIDEPIDARCTPDWQMRLVPLSATIEQRRADLAAKLPMLDGSASRLVANFAALN